MCSSEKSSLSIQSWLYPSEHVVPGATRISLTAIWVTGQIGSDRKTGKPTERIEAQTERALENLKDVLERAGPRVEECTAYTRLSNPARQPTRGTTPSTNATSRGSPQRRLLSFAADNIHHPLIDIGGGAPYVRRRRGCRSLPVRALTRARRCEDLGGPELPASASRL